MALKGDEFFQKAVQCLARALAHLNPTPEEKVLSIKLIFQNFIDLPSLEKYFAAPTTVSALSPGELCGCLLHRFTGSRSYRRTRLVFPRK